MVQIEANSQRFLRSPLRPSLFRAATDSDLGFMGLAMGKAGKLGPWGKLTLDGLGKPSEIDWAADSITIIHRLKGMTLTRVYRIGANGELDISCTLNTGKTAPRRFGMQLEMDAAYDQFTWFGRGPHDTYWGRDDSGLVQIHSAGLTEQDEYMRPQEHGNKREVRWLTLTDKDGIGLQISAVSEPICASAWPYTLAELHKATHVHELPAGHVVTTVNIDAVQNGLGDCFVPCPERYKLQPGSEYSYQFRIRPCKV